MRSSESAVPTRPRERILDTAIRLFIEDGIQAVGVNRIIVEAGVAPMTLYRKFGSKDELVAEALQEWSDQWLHWLNVRLDCSGDDPGARFAGLWKALEEWLASEEFNGSFVAYAATELRGKRHHPAHETITAHQMAMRQLLEDLARLAGAADSACLASQLHVILDGALAAAVIDRSVGAASIRALASAALDASSLVAVHPE